MASTGRGRDLSNGYGLQLSDGEERERARIRSPDHCMHVASSTPPKLLKPNNCAWFQVGYTVIGRRSMVELKYWFFFFSVCLDMRIDDVVYV